MKNVYTEQSRSGFTLLELLMVMGIASILLSLTTINLTKVHRNVSVSASSDTLIADLKSQQIKAMSGSDNESFGIHFSSSNSYILFKGTPYVADPADFTVTLDDPITVAITNPPANQEIIFSKVSGEVGEEKTIRITNTAGSEEQTLTINKLGVIKDAN